MTNEPPAGLKQNLIGSFGTDPISNRTWFDSSTMPNIFRKMLFGIVSSTLSFKNVETSVLSVGIFNTSSMNQIFVLVPGSY